MHLIDIVLSIWSVLQRMSVLSGGLLEQPMPDKSGKRYFAGEALEAIFADENSYE